MRKLIIVLAFAAVAAMALVVGIRLVQSQSSEEYAVKVNGQQISAKTVDEALKARQRAADLAERAGSARPDVDRAAVVQSLIENQLLLQEASRRGFECSSEEVELYITRVIPREGEAAVLAVVASGLAPDGYVDTPASERTPGASELIDAYTTNPAVQRSVQRQCVISKLYQTLGDPGADGQVDGLERDQAIASLKAQLLGAASVDRSPGY